MWASHAVHHSSEQLTLLSSVRLGWTNALSGGWVVYLPLVVAGFDPRMILGLLAFDLHFQFFLHTEAPIRLGPLEWVLNTPQHHKLHHAMNAPYLDRNFGGVLIVFDRMLGTFAREVPEETPRFGLVHRFESGTPWGIALGEWRRLFADLFAARDWRTAARAALGRPV
jgi:sterol desaturase/sphingolipid hydroxylase (fatty acid hydroxylase superfamily)